MLKRIHPKRGLQTPTQVLRILKLPLAVKQIQGPIIHDNIAETRILVQENQEEKNKKRR